MSDPQPRRYRHRGPRRASGGTWTEPEDGAAAPAEGERARDPVRPSDAGSARNRRPGSAKDGSARDAGASKEGSAPGASARGDASLDARARWLMEERPPHWG